MNTHLILNIPHASTWITGVSYFPAVHIAAAYGAVMNMVHNELLPMPDWYIELFFSQSI